MPCHSRQVGLAVCRRLGIGWHRRSAAPSLAHMPGCVLGFVGRLCLLCLETVAGSIQLGAVDRDRAQSGQPDLARQQQDLGEGLLESLPVEAPERRDGVVVRMGVGGHEPHAKITVRGPSIRRDENRPLA